MADLRKRLNEKDWLAVGESVKAELDRRKGERRGLERLWKEVDRQIAMSPKGVETESGDKDDWFPAIELPLQFNALEVIAADARRLKFPRGSEWFSVSADLSDDYMERWAKRRETKALIGGTPLQVKLDQETANNLVKATMDYYHRLYDFRTQIDLFDTECIKYGTGIGRVRAVQHADFGYDFRGLKTSGLIGPAVIACSIKNTYLDTSQPAVMQEGISSSPSVIRTMTQRLENLQRAAKVGGAERGWIASQIKRLEPPSDEQGRSNMVELVEIEGDLIVPRSRESIFLPNVLVTIAVGAGAPRPVRFRENPLPFRSYVVGHYMRDEVKSAYGASPLMKGHPIQEAASDVFNQMLAVAALNAMPPLAWDKNDPNLAATGGPEWYPGAQWPSDAPNSVDVQQVGDLGSLLNTYLALLKQFEDLTGANDPRRGEPARSHTTATAADLEVGRGLSRTDDFVTAQEQGPITSMLYMEYQIIKDRMKSVISLPVEAGGIEGFANVAAPDLADDVAFLVQGSAGAINERERLNNFIQATTFALQTAQQAAALQQPVPLNFQEIMVEAYQRAGIQNASRFVGGAQSVPSGAAPPTPVPGTNSGAPTLPAPAVAA